MSHNYEKKKKKKKKKKKRDQLLIFNIKKNVLMIQIILKYN